MKIENVVPILEWAEGKGDINVSIEVGRGELKRAWVTSNSLLVGQFVSTVSEINLAAVKKQKEWDEYRRLRKKLEGGVTSA